MKEGYDEAVKTLVTDGEISRRLLMYLVVGESHDYDWCDRALDSRVIGRV